MLAANEVLSADQARIRDLDVVTRGGHIVYARSLTTGVALWHSMSRVADKKMLKGRSSIAHEKMIMGVE